MLLLPPLVVADQGPEKGEAAQTPAPIFILDQICSQTFGNIDALNYKIIEEGKESKWFSYRPCLVLVLFFIDLSIVEK